MDNVTAKFFLLALICTFEICSMESQRLLPAETEQPLKIIVLEPTQEIPGITIHEIPRKGEKWTSISKQHLQVPRTDDIPNQGERLPNFFLEKVFVDEQPKDLLSYSDNEAPDDTHCLDRNCKRALTSIGMAGCCTGILILAVQLLSRWATFN